MIEKNFFKLGGLMVFLYKYINEKIIIELFIIIIGIKKFKL